jgi:hypothetical protein
MLPVSYCECDYDADQPEFYAEYGRIARKVHTCSECDGLILPGERYIQRSGKWHGDVQNYPKCLLCDELERWARITMPCFCVSTFGELHERCCEMVDDIKDVVPGITFEWGRRMVRIEKRAGKRK